MPVPRSPLMMAPNIGFVERGYIREWTVATTPMMNLTTTPPPPQTTTPPPTHPPTTPQHVIHHNTTHHNATTKSGNLETMLTNMSTIELENQKCFHTEFFHHVIFVGGINAGTFRRIGVVGNMTECVSKCCDTP